MSAELDNLCGIYEHTSLEESVQIFILKFIANVQKCPIRKVKRTNFKICFNIYTIKLTNWKNLMYYFNFYRVQKPHLVYH